MPIKKMPQNSRIEIMLQAALDKLAAIEQEQAAAKEREARREHLDALVLAHDEAMHDNGKVGLKTIRNQWIGLQGKWNAVVVALIIEILINVLK